MNACAFRRIVRSIAALSLLLGIPLAAFAETYVVLYQQNSVPSTAAKSITAAGGTLVASYSQIGVAIARSDNASFAPNMQKVKGIQSVSATSGLGVPVGGLLAFDTADAPPADLRADSSSPQSRCPPWASLWVCAIS